jgi:hypothetical protein
MIAMLTLLFGASSMIFSTKQSYADVKIERDAPFRGIFIYNTISKADANYIAQRETYFETGGMFLTLDSTGGDVDAALQIGRIIRKNEGIINVREHYKCYSSCALIYIAGVQRSNFGVIGLHRPYLASTPQSRQSIERETPLMLQKLNRHRSCRLMCRNASRYLLAL